jgi:hypothetical protein
MPGANRWGLLPGANRIRSRPLLVFENPVEIHFVVMLFDQQAVDSGFDAIHVHARIRAKQRLACAMVEKGPFHEGNAVEQQREVRFTKQSIVKWVRSVASSDGGGHDDWKKRKGREEK